MAGLVTDCPASGAARMQVRRCGRPYTTRDQMSRVERPHQPGQVRRVAAVFDQQPLWPAADAGLPNLFRAPSGRPGSANVTARLGRNSDCECPSRRAADSIKSVLGGSAPVSGSG